MSTLTDRYVHAVTQLLPPSQREDIAAELRGTLEDAVADRAPGVSEEEAERAALVGLGHPTRLADSYRGSGRSLIGPTVYPAWVRVLKTLLSFIPVLVAIVVLTVDLVQGSAVGEAVWSALGAAFFAVVNVVFWVTFGFAVAERYQTEEELLVDLGESSADWDPDDLPAAASGQVSWGDALASVIGTAVMLALILLPGNLSVVVDGEPLSIFSDLALTLRWVLAAGLALSLVAEAFVLARGRWNWSMAVVNVVGNVLFGGVLAWLLMSDRLFDAPWVLSEEVAQGVGWEAWGPPTLLVTGIVVLAISVWDAVSGLRKAAAS